MTIVLKAMKVMMKKILWIKVIVMKIKKLKQEIKINIIFNLEKLEEKKNQINKKKYIIKSNNYIQNKLYILSSLIFSFLKII